MNGSIQKVLTALCFAARKHKGQQRRDKKTPYINHPIAVAALLNRVGKVTDVATLQAALLHDTLEDTDTTAEELEQYFGKDVRFLVQELTDDKSLPREERKRLEIDRASNLSLRAKQIKLADKACNVEETDLTQPVGWSAERKLAYLEHASSVSQGCKGCSLELEEHFSAVLEKQRERFQHCAVQITNGDLFHGRLQLLKPNSLCVVCSSPHIASSERRIEVYIDMDKLAAVVDDCADHFPHQPRVSEIILDRTRSTWLLSGGFLITDGTGRTAVGLRDGNSLDPFVFTNIAAGRCDRPFKLHCRQELQTEFLMAVQTAGIWNQAIVGAETQSLRDLTKPDVQVNLEKVLSRFNSRFSKLSSLRCGKRAWTSGELWTLKLHWVNQNKVEYEETAIGLLCKGQGNTIEFRVPIQIDLSRYEDTQLFYGEGTGHAEWWPLERISQVARFEGSGRKSLLTPFLRDLALCEDLLLVLCPAGALHEILVHYRERARTLFGENGSHQYPPHCTLIRHFKADPKGVVQIQNVLNELLPGRPTRLEVAQIRILEPVMEPNYHTLPLESVWLTNIVKQLVDQCLGFPTVGFMRVKDKLTVNLAYNFHPNNELGLRELAKSLLRQLPIATWELRLVRDPKRNFDGLQHWTIAEGLKGADVAH